MERKEKPSEKSSADPKTDSKRPQKWWQWMLVYPALIIALLSSIPTYLEFFRSHKYGVSYGQSLTAKQQNDLWNKNLTCQGAPLDWYINEYNIGVDATICKSGDVLIRVKEPDGKGRCTWVPVEGLIQKRANVSLLAQAYAFEPVLSFQTAQTSGTVICQRFIQNGRLLRRIQTQSGCYDEIINTYTGEVLGQNPAPCDPNC